MPINPLKQLDKQLTWQDKLADKITAFCGDMRFVYFHTVWFGIWIILNVVAWAEGWDPYPFGLLTMIVSLEAIFLSTFILISQNRQNQRSELRAQLDYDIDRKAEREIAKIRELLAQILENQRKLHGGPKS